jgi:Type II secretion system (T2SS), protein M subtype b
MNLLNRVLARLGVLGVLGIGALIFCLPFYFGTLRPAEQDLAAQRAAAQRLQSRGPFRAVAVDDRAEDLLRFYALLPPLEQLPEELGRVYALARAARLELNQGEYRLDQRASGPVAYRVTLPIHGSYAQLRAFLDSVLREMPIASIDALRFERRRAAETQVDAQVHLTLNFRPSGDDMRR